MKRITVKLIAAALSLIIMAGAFSACGSKSDDEITRSNEVIAKPETTTEDPFADMTDNTEESTTSAEEETISSSGILDGFGDLTTTRPGSEPTTVNTSGIQNLNPIAVAKFINDMGFEYDATQGIFYSAIDSWQRSANYFSHYDAFAKYGNMRYVTDKIDFTYDDMDYRIQIWKGQYGIFGGAEIGVYTKKPGTNEMVYKCADDDHLLNMYFDLYENQTAYLRGERYFYRDAWTGAGHWWLTGFKFGVVVPTNMVLYGKIHMKTNGMASEFERALKKAGFKAGDALSQYDTYRRDGRDFYFLWKDIGTLNY